MTITSSAAIAPEPERGRIVVYGRGEWIEDDAMAMVADLWMVMLMWFWFGFVKIFVGGGRRCESWREEKIFLGTARRNINMGNWRESEFRLPPAASAQTQSQSGTERHLLALAPHIFITITITITHHLPYLPTTAHHPSIRYHNPSISPSPAH